MQSLATLYLVILPLVMAAAVVEGLWLSRTRAEAYDWKSWACSLADLAGRRLLAFIPYTFAAPWLGWIYEYRLFTQSLDSVWSVLLLFVGLEFFYYWFHRASHTVRWFWSSHSVHHSPNQFNFAAAYRLGWLEYVLNTPSAHRVHHARNPEYLDANFGGVLIVFDRLFGTYVAERDEVKCDFGLVSPQVSSRNPFALNFGPWIGLVKDLAAARSAREVWMYLFGAPGWRPDGTGLTAAELRKAHALRTERAETQPAMT